MLVLALAVPAAADGHLITELHYPHQNTECDGTGVWHFVHNQAPKGSFESELAVWFDAGAGPYMVTFEDARFVGKWGKTHHWWVKGYPGDLVTARSSLEGKLVLSEYMCYDDPSGPSGPSTH